jgi:uncharacterized protein with NRDE domain
MCLVAMLWRVVEDAPLIVAANREESFDRPGTLPQLAEGPLGPFVAGRDPRAGGTWLGVNRFGLLAAVTNGPKSRPPAEPRSRGLLVMDLLGQCRNANDANALASHELEQRRYAGCNLVCADVRDLHVIHGGDFLRAQPMPPGIHVLTTGLVNNEADRRIAFGLSWLKSQPWRRVQDWLPTLEEFCRMPAGEGRPAMCWREDGRGTVSSTLVVLRDSLAASAYWHAQGPPDTTAYQDFTPLLARLS